MSAGQEPTKSGKETLSGQECLDEDLVSCPYHPALITHR